MIPIIFVGIFISVVLAGICITAIFVKSARNHLQDAFDESHEARIARQQVQVMNHHRRAKFHGKNASFDDDEEECASAATTTIPACDVLPYVTAHPISCTETFAPIVDTTANATATSTSMHDTSMASSSSPDVGGGGSGGGGGACATSEI